MAVLGKDGRYDLHEAIGDGPRGTVHRATDLRRRVPVVLRRLDPARAPPAAVARYTEAVAAVKKAGVAAAVLPLDIVAQEPGPFVVGAALEGESLAVKLAGGPLPWSRAVEIVASIATTLAAVASAGGPTHRALEPSAVWLAPDGAVLVLDYGVVAFGPAAPVHRGSHWLEYRAPEQLDGADGDARTDVFTLAVLLVELTTGVHPFAGATAYQAAQKLLQTPPDLEALTGGMPPAGARELTRLMTQALASEPDDRHADVAAFAARLAQVRPLVGSPAPIRPAPARPEPPPQPQAPVDPSTMQSLPLLRQLLVQRSTEPAPVTATPAIATPVSVDPPTEIVASPAVASSPAPAPEPPVVTPRAEVPRAASRPSPVATAPRTEAPRAASRPMPAAVDPRDLLAPPPDDPPTLVGHDERPAPPAREEHTVVDRRLLADAAPPASDRTVADFAMPTAPRARGEHTEILRPAAFEDEEEDKPTVALRRGPIPGLTREEGTLILQDQPIPGAASSERAPRRKPTGTAPPSARVQWTLIAVNAIVVLLVLAVLLFTFLR